MSLFNLFGLFNNKSHEIDDLKKQLNNCKNSRNKYKKKYNEYKNRLCNNFTVPNCEKFIAYDARGKFNLFEISDGCFVNVSLDPLPCVYNYYKKNYWNSICDSYGVDCLVAGTFDEINTKCVSNPPHQNDKVIMQFQLCQFLEY